MAHSILIVDDDPKIKEGLAAHIDWGQLGFHSPLKASGGHEALELFKYNKLDVMITDIKMPIMSGLELSEIVTKQYKDTVIIILSAFHEFDYAKTAMMYGIKHYITKPTDLEQLSKVLSIIVLELENALLQKEKQEGIEKKFHTAMELLIEQFFLDLSHGSIKSMEQVNQFIRDHQIHFPYSRYCLIRIELLNMNGDSEREIKLGRLVKQNAFDYPLRYYSFCDRERVLNLILNFDRPDELALYAKTLLHAAATIGITIQLAVSKEVYSLDALSVCYRQAREAMQRGKKLHSSDVIHYDDSDETSRDISYDVDKEKVWLIYIAACDEEKALHMIDSLFSPLLESHALRETFHEYFTKLCFALESIVAEFNLEMKQIAGERIFPIQKVAQLSNEHEIISWLKSHTLKTIRYLQEAKIPGSYRFVEKLKSYIETNYMKDITLHSASLAVHLSPAYVSKLFKKATGQSFVEYLTSIRINKAKTLLSDFHTKVYEVGSMVGYQNTKHFSQVFKANCGMTPSEYRESLQTMRNGKPLA